MRNCNYRYVLYLTSVVLLAFSVVSLSSHALGGQYAEELLIYSTEINDLNNMDKSATAQTGIYPGETGYGCMQCLFFINDIIETSTMTNWVQISTSMDPLTTSEVEVETDDMYYSYSHHYLGDPTQSIIFDHKKSDDGPYINGELVLDKANVSDLYKKIKTTGNEIEKYLEFSDQEYAYKNFLDIMLNNKDADNYDLMLESFDLNVLGKYFKHIKAGDSIPNLWIDYGKQLIYIGVKKADGTYVVNYCEWKDTESKKEPYKWSNLKLYVK